jgi:hypothetical protein
MNNKIIAIYIIFWVSAMVINFIGGYEMSYQSILLILISMLAYVIGVKIKIFKFEERKLLAVGKSNLKIIKLIKLFFIINIINSLYSIFMVSKYGFEFRYMTFEVGGQYNNIVINMIIQYVVNPMTLIASVFAVALKSNRSKMRFYYVSLMLMQALSSLGRFPIYYLIYLMVVDLIISKKVNFKILIIYLICAVSLVGLSIKLLVDKLNSESNLGFDIYEILEKFVINYHIIGFHMIDKYIGRDFNINYDWTFPTVSLGFFGWLTHLVTKSIGFLVFPNNYMLFMEDFNGGFYFEELGWSYNAFTTGLLPIFADGGILAICFFYYIYGKIARIAYGGSIWLTEPMLILVTMLLLFSIFQPLNMVALPITTIYTLLIFKYSKNKFKW